MEKVLINIYKDEYIGLRPPRNITDSIELFLLKQEELFSLNFQKEDIDTDQKFKAISYSNEGITGIVFASESLKRYLLKLTINTDNKILYQSFANFSKNLKNTYSLEELKKRALDSLDEDPIPLINLSDFALSDLNDDNDHKSIMKILNEAIDSKSEKVRANIPYIIYACPKYWEYFLPILEKHKEKEKDEYVLECINGAIRLIKLEIENE